MSQFWPHGRGTRTRATAQGRASGRGYAAVALACLLLLVFFALAPAAEFGELRTPDREVTVRATRERKSAAVRTLKPGELVRIGVEKDGLVAVFEPDEAKKAIGYAEARHLVPAKEPARPAVAPAPAAEPAVPAEPKYAERRLEIRQARTTQSASLGVLNQGEAVLAAFPKDGWYAVFRPGSTVRSESEALGYVPIAALLHKSVADLSESAVPFKGQGPGSPAMPGPGELIPGGAEARFPVQAVGPKPGAASKPPLPLTAGPVEPPRPESPAASVPAPAAAPAPTAPVPPGLEKLAKNAIKVTSDKMTYSEAENIITFSGNVHAVHTQLTIDANKILVHLASDSKKGGETVEKIEKIVAEGNVRMLKGNTEGYCAHATYFVKDGTLRMEGDPMVKDGPNTVKGEVILFYVKENRSEVIGGKKRVEAVFYSTKDQAR